MGNVQGGPQGGTESGSTLKWSKSGKRRKLGNESGNWTSCEGRSKVKKLGRKKGLWVKGGWHRGEVERDNQSVLEAQNRSCTHTHTHISASSYPCWALFAADCTLSPVTFIISHSLIFQPLTMALLTLSSPCSTSHSHTHTLSPHHEQSPHPSSPSLHQSAGSVPVIPLPSVH